LPNSNYTYIHLFSCINSYIPYDLNYYSNIPIMHTSNIFTYTHTSFPRNRDSRYIIKSRQPNGRTLSFMLFINYTKFVVIQYLHYIPHINIHTLRTNTYSHTLLLFLLHKSTYNFYLFIFTYLTHLIPELVHTHTLYICFTYTHDIHMHLQYIHLHILHTLNPTYIYMRLFWNFHITYIRKIHIHITH